MQDLTKGEIDLLRIWATALMTNCDQIVKVRNIPADRQDEERLSIAIQAMVMVAEESGADPSDSIAIPAKVAGHLIGLSACCQAHTKLALSATAAMMGAECAHTLLDRNRVQEPEIQQ